MKKVLWFAVSLLLIGTLHAQSENTTPLPRSLRGGITNTQNQESKRPDLFVGGDVNTNFSYNLSLSANIGLYAQPWLRFGIGPRYEMSYLYGLGDVEHAYGATAYAEAIVANYVLFHAGYEYLSYPSTEMDEFNVEIDVRKNLHALAIGAGFETNLSESVSLYLLYLIYPVMNHNDYLAANYFSRIPMFARLGISYTF